MNSEASLSYADRLGQVFARYSSVPPVAGRLLGYLIICKPEQQSINELASALKASRSAIVGAVQLLEARHVVKRTRAAGDRNDLIYFDINGFESRGFDASAYLQMAALFHEGLMLVKGDSEERQSHVQELIDFAQFLAERMPLLQKDWHETRDSKRENDLNSIG
jgi:DNA-binding transcriptional regulator GbsR (MarR family)